MNPFFGSIDDPPGRDAVAAGMMGEAGRQMPAAGKVRLGCEVLAANPPDWFRSGRLGLLVNQASVTGSFEHVRDVLRRAGGRLTCLLSPQHGFHAEKQANMIESEDSWDAGASIPVISLYGKSREPSREVLESMDVLVIDLQDVGTRVYTFGVTMGLCMEAAARTGTRVVVLDRPNPIGGLSVEGNVLDEGYRSFVGRYPIPMRHGLTMGELARFVRARCGVDCDLVVVPMDGWRRGDYFCDTGLDWCFPSPNMPAWETALLYPGMVLFEGTNVSEGRGTTLPFHVFGAPFIDQHRLASHLADAGLGGVAFRPVCFEPVFDKWQGSLCRGFQIHVTDRNVFSPFRLALTLLQGLRKLHPDEFQWLEPPYEYELEKLPIDILLGDGGLRKKLEDGVSPVELAGTWAGGLDAYRAACDEVLLYR